MVLLGNAAQVAHAAAEVDAALSGGGEGAADISGGLGSAAGVDHSTLPSLLLATHYLLLTTYYLLLTYSQVWTHSTLPSPRCRLDTSASRGSCTRTARACCSVGTARQVSTWRIEPMAGRSDL